MAAISPPRMQATSTSVEVARTADGGLDGQLLLRFRRLLSQATGPETRAETLSRLTGALRSIGWWDLLSIAQLPADGGELILEGLEAPTGGLGRELQLQLQSSGRQALTARHTVTHRAQEPAGWIVATPCLPAASVETSALVAFSTQAVALKPQSLLLLECAASELAQAEIQRKLLQSEHDLTQTAAVVELLERLSRTRSLEQLDQRLVTELAGVLPGCQVVIGRQPSRGGACRVTAVSDVGTESMPAVDRERLAAVMDEALIRRRLSSWPAQTVDEEAGLLVHRQYVQQQAGCWLVTTPIDGQDGEAAVLLVQGTVPSMQPQALRLVSAALPPIAAMRNVARLAQQGPLTRWRRGLGRWMAQRRVRLGVLLTAAVVGTLLVPIPHRVRCDCDLEPVSRQFVAAPFGAPLAEVFVQPGDTVAAGQLLARLDGREIHWELSGVSADLQRASRERDGHLAEHDSGAARLSQLEMERLRMRTELLQHRTELLEIRSPVAGLLISGDLDDAVGAPLEVGQTLFEIAPIDQLVAELRIPERDIPYARNGQPVRYWLDSQPDEPRDGVISRLTPRAEIREGESVFIAEVAVDNSAEWLRPGMHGTARINVGACRLGWSLFHRAWETTRVWVGL